MSVVSLEQFKKHTRTDDYNADDELLEFYLQAAEESVVMATNRTVEELTARNGGTFPTTLMQAVMMLAAHWHNQRESVSAVQMHSVPDSLQSLIKPWRRFTLRSDSDAGRENEL